MTAQREHRVPLCGRAVEILREAGRLSPVKLLGIAAVPHGFRSSCWDWAAERTKNPREVIDAALAHMAQPQNRVEAAYACSDLIVDYDGTTVRPEASGGLRVGSARRICRLAG